MERLSPRFSKAIRSIGAVARLVCNWRIRLVNLLCNLIDLRGGEPSTSCLWCSPTFLDDTRGKTI